MGTIDQPDFPGYTRGKQGLAQAETKLSFVKPSIILYCPHLVPDASLLAEEIRSEPLPQRTAARSRAGSSRPRRGTLARPAQGGGMAGAAGPHGAPSVGQPARHGGAHRSPRACTQGGLGDPNATEGLWALENQLGSSEPTAPARVSLRNASSLIEGADLRRWPTENKRGKAGARGLEEAAPASSAKALARSCAVSRGLGYATDRRAGCDCASSQQKPEKTHAVQYPIQVAGDAARGWHKALRGAGPRGADPMCATSHGAAGGDDSSPGRSWPPKAPWSCWEGVAQPRPGTTAHPLPASHLTPDPCVASPCTQPPAPHRRMTPATGPPRFSARSSSGQRGGQRAKAAPSRRGAAAWRGRSRAAGGLCTS